MGFKHFVAASLVVLGVGGLPAPNGAIGTAADAGIARTKQIFAHKSWRVRFVAFDDNSIACEARVGSSSNNLSIWADSGTNASLQFHNSGWQFNDSTANVRVRIDSRARWNLNDASLKNSSVFFTLPDGDQAIRFLREVMRGNVLKLYSSSGTLIERYTLAGSSASILALIRCVDVLKSNNTDTNPFD